LRGRGKKAERAQSNDQDKNSSRHDFTVWGGHSGPPLLTWTFPVVRDS
jgi:hypothetical protein